MNHIERMEVELKELKEKIEKGEEFINKEFIERKFTDETQRANLHAQLFAMQQYADILEIRIKYDKNKNKEE